MDELRRRGRGGGGAVRSLFLEKEGQLGQRKAGLSVRPGHERPDVPVDSRM